jgi:hypothetical protein
MFKTSLHQPATPRVPHGYGHTRGFWATGPTVTGTVPDFHTWTVTVPVYMVSRCSTNTFTGPDHTTLPTSFVGIVVVIFNINIFILLSEKVQQKGWRCRQTTNISSLVTGTILSHKSITSR